MKTVKIRSLTLGDGAPKICVPITARTEAELEQQLCVLRESPWDMVEWRADYFEETKGEGWIPGVLSLLRNRIGDRPLLFTYRTKEEGGEGSVSLETYRRYNEEAAVSRMADLVDVELNRGEGLLREQAEMLHGYGTAVVGSFHDFSGTPRRETIVSILRSIQELGADISKAAVMPHCERDVMTLLEASLSMKEKYGDRPYITMSMGRLGAVSRLAGGLTGSAVTFATAGRASAPGQMEAGLLSKLLAAMSLS